MTSINSRSNIHEFVKLQAEAFRTFNTNNAEKSLNKGIWYPTEYLDALNQQERTGLIVEWMKNTNICQWGYVSYKSFVPIQEDSKFGFVAKTNTVASEALKEITEGFAILECCTASQLSLWKALRDYIGLKNFDALLSLPRKVFPPLYLQQGGCILTDLYETVNIQGEEDILPGDLVYFKNITKYSQRNPIGSAAGYNTLCVLAKSAQESIGPIFMGFGLGIDGNSSAEIESHFFEEHNKKLLELRVYLSEELAQEIEEQAQKAGQSSIQNTLTWEEFQQERSEDKNGVSGRLVLKIRRPRFDRIEQLKKTPPTELGKLIASWR